MPELKLNIRYIIAGIRNGYFSRIRIKSNFSAAPAPGFGRAYLNFMCCQKLPGHFNIFITHIKISITLGEHGSAAENMGIKGLLIKPLTIDDLSKNIRKVLD